MTGNPGSRGGNRGRGRGRGRGQNGRGRGRGRGGVTYSNRSRSDIDRIAENAKRYLIHPDFSLNTWIEELESLGGLKFTVDNQALDFSFANQNNNPCGWESDLLCLFDIQVFHYFSLCPFCISSYMCFFDTPTYPHFSTCPYYPFQIKPRPAEYFTKWAQKYGIASTGYRIHTRSDDKAFKVSFLGASHDQFLSLFKMLMFGMSAIDRESYWGITPVLPIIQEGWINPPKSPRNNLSWKFVLPDCRAFRTFISTHRERWVSSFDAPSVDDQVQSLIQDLPRLIADGNWNFTIPTGFRPKPSVCRESCENLFHVFRQDTRYLGSTPKQQEYLDAAIRAGSFGLYSNSFVLLDSKGLPIFYRPPRSTPEQQVVSAQDKRCYNVVLNYNYSFKVSISTLSFRHQIHFRLMFLAQPRHLRHSLTAEECFLKELKSCLDRYFRTDGSASLPSNYEILRRIQRGEPSLSTVSFDDFTDFTTRVVALEGTVKRHGDLIHNHQGRLLRIEDTYLPKDQLADELARVLPDALRNQTVHKALTSLTTAPARYSSFSHLILHEVNLLIPHAHSHLPYIQPFTYFSPPLEISQVIAEDFSLFEPAQISPLGSALGSTATDSDATNISHASSPLSEDQISHVPENQLDDLPNDATFNIEPAASLLSSTLDLGTRELPRSPSPSTQAQNNPYIEQEQPPPTPLRPKTPPIPVPSQPLSISPPPSSSLNSLGPPPLPSLPQATRDLSSHSSPATSASSISAMRTQQHSVYSPTTCRDHMLPQSSVPDIYKILQQSKRPPPIQPNALPATIKLIKPFDDLTLASGELPHPLHLATIPSHPSVIITDAHPEWQSLSLEAKLTKSLKRNDVSLLSACFPSANIAKSADLLCTPLELSHDETQSDAPHSSHTGQTHIAHAGFRVSLAPSSHARREWIAFALFEPMTLIALLSVSYLRLLSKYASTPATDLQRLRIFAEYLTELKPLLHNLWRLKVSLERGSFCRSFPKQASKQTSPSEWAKRVPAISMTLYKHIFDLAKQLNLPKPPTFVGREGPTYFAKLQKQYSPVSLYNFFSTAPLPPHHMSLQISCLLFPVYASSHEHSYAQPSTPNISVLAQRQSTTTSDSSRFQPRVDEIAASLINPYFTLGDNLEMQVIENINRHNIRWVGDTPAHELDLTHPLLRSLVAPEHITACGQNLLIPKTASTVLKQPAPAKHSPLNPLTLATFGSRIKSSLKVELPDDIYTKRTTSPPELHGTDFCLLYTNLNSPSTQLGPLFAMNPRTAIFALTELNIDPRLLRTEFTGLFQYTVFHHTPAISSTGPRVYAAIFVHHEIISEAKQLPTTGPFISLYCTHEHFKFNIACFYRPLNTSNKITALARVLPDYEDNYEAAFITSFQHVINTQFKVPSIICGDCNFQLTPPRRQDSSFLVQHFMRLTGRYTDHVQGHPTFQRDNVSSSIDCLLSKDCHFAHVHFDNSGLFNDGHAVISAILPYRINITPITRLLTVRKQLSDVQINLVSYLIYPYIQKVLFLTETSSKCWFNNSITHTMEILQQDHRQGYSTSFNRDLYTLADHQAYSVVLGTHLTFLLDLLTPEEHSLVPFNRVAALPSHETTLLAHVAQVVKSHLTAPSLDDDTRQAYIAKFRLIKKAFHSSLRKDRRKLLTKLHPRYTTINDVYTINRRLHCKTPKTVLSESFSAAELASYFENLQWNGAHEKIIRCSHINVFDKWNIPLPARKLRFEEFIPSWDGRTKFESVKLCFQTLKTHNQGHLTGYNKRFLSLLCDKFSTFLYNAVMSDILLGIYPQHYLTNKVKPIPKKDPSAGIRNHRFISVPDPLASLTGKTAAAMSISYTRKYKVWSPNQHGFLPKRGTTTAMAELFLNLKDVPSSSPVISFSIDIANGFGSPPFSTLMTGISRTVHINSAQYFTQLLQPRLGIIYHDGDRSSPVILPMLGVPQGEPCSPWMFNLIMDGLKVVLNHHKIRVAAYADDWFITFVGDPYESMSSISTFATNTLTKAIEFLSDIGMILSTSKSFFFVSSSHPPPSTITLPSGYLHHKSSFKHLGFHLNQKLDSLDHSAFLLQRLIEIRQMIGNLLHLTNRQHVLIFAYALIFGQLNYLAPVSPRYSHAQSNKIQRVIIHTLQDILQVPLPERRQLSYATTLNAVGWLSFENNSSRLKIKYLHDLFCAQDPFRLARIINLMIFQSDGKTKSPFQHYSTRSAKSEHVIFDVHNHYLLTNFQSRDLPSTFPFNAMLLFNELPSYVRDLFGHSSFVPTLNLYFHSFCQHRAGKSRTTCTNCAANATLTEVSRSQFNSLYQSLLTCQPLFNELRNLPSSLPTGGIKHVRLLAIESVLFERLPFINSDSPIDDVDFLFHSTLRTLRDQGFIPPDSPASL